MQKEAIDWSKLGATRKSQARRGDLTGTAGALLTASPAIRSHFAATAARRGTALYPKPFPQGET
jgi:hypothetical protein